MSYFSFAAKTVKRSSSPRSLILLTREFFSFVALHFADVPASFCFFSLLLALSNSVSWAHNLLAFCSLSTASHILSSSLSCHCFSRSLTTFSLFRLLFSPSRESFNGDPSLYVQG